MAAINHAHVGFTADATVVNSGTYTAIPNTQFASTDFVGSNRYLLLWRFAYDSTGSGAQVFKGQWQWDTAGAITKTTTISEEATLTAGAVQLISGATLITSPATPENLQYYAGRQVSGGTIVMNDFKAVVIDLDDLTENTDWFFAEDDDIGANVNAGTSGTPISFASLTQTFDAGDWILFPYIIFAVNNTGSSHVADLSWSGGGLTTDNSANFELEGEDTAEETTHMLPPKVVNLDGTSATFSVRGATSSGDGAHQKHIYSSLVAINLGVFEEFFSTFTAAEFESSGGTYNEAAALTPFTPATSGNFLVLGGGVGAGDAAANTRIQVGGVDLDQANTADDLRTYDARDNHLFCNIGMDSFSGSTDIDLDMKSATAGDGILDRTLIAISMELAGGGGGTVAIGTASETSSALSITPSGPVLVSVGIASETSSALAMSAQKDISVALGLASETSSVFPISPTSDVIVTLGLPSDTSTAASISPIKDISVAVGLASESDTVSSITPTAAQVIPIGLASGAESPLAMTVIKTIYVQLGVATDVSVPLDMVASGPVVLAVSCRLVDINGNALPNLDSLSYAWFDESDPADFSTPLLQGAVESTDASGNIEVPLPGTTLSSGGVGTLILRSSSGTLFGAYNLAAA